MDIAGWAVEQWPQIYPNLIASGICWLVVWVRMHVHHKRVVANQARIESLLHRVLHKETVIEQEEGS